MKPDTVPFFEKLFLFLVLAAIVSAGCIGLALPTIGLLYLVGALK